MKIKQVLLLTAVALVCGGIAGYGSAHLVVGGREHTVSSVAEQAVASVTELRFLDGSGNTQVILELGGRHRPGLVLKDSAGNVLYDLPPSFKLLPAEGS